MEQGCHKLILICVLFEIVSQDVHLINLTFARMLQ